MFQTRTDTRTATRRKAAKRLSKLGARDVLDWADVAGSAVARLLNDYRRDGNAESLQEAREGLEALLGCVDVLQGR